jgi:hypothetical protein
MHACVSWESGGGAYLYLTLHRDMNMPIMSSSDVVNNVSGNI